MADILNQWWVWLSGAVVLAILEVLVPGYIFLGFAIAGVVMAGLVGIGIATWSVPAQLVVFAVLALIAFLALRQVFGIRHGQVKIWDRDINE